MKVLQRAAMWRMAFLLLCCAMAAPICAEPRDTPNLADSQRAGIDRLVHALCSKQVVMLGEDRNHGSGATIEVKVRLVERLVQQCGFRGVVFESQFYDMLDFEHSIAAGSATPEQLSDAIGPVWSRYSAVAKLVTWLFDEAKAGHVRLAGMDPQVGGIDEHYSEHRLAAVLASALSSNRRTDCEVIISRNNQWTYDDAHPFGAAALSQLRSCLKDIRELIAKNGPHAPSELSAIADSYANYLGFADGGAPGLRDRAMFTNFVWIRAHWPKGTRIVIWTASVHAAKILEGFGQDVRPFGSYVHEALGDHAAAIGFSALGGSYGNVGGHGAPHVIHVAAPGTLEAQAFARTDTGALHFVDRKQLKAMGPVSARALDYSKPEVLDWSRVLDGIIVLRKETAAVAMHYE